VLMKRFYRYLRQQPPLTALQRAQALVRRYHPHPAHWAGFFLTGSWL
jgi:CHAT domain-containing protein